MRDRIGWKPSSTDFRGASSRIRCLYPLRQLESRGYPVELFDSTRADRYATVVYQKLFDPASQREAEALAQQGVRIVFDLCDNLWYNPRSLPDQERAGAGVTRMMTLAHELVASTDELVPEMRVRLPRPCDIAVIADAVETRIDGLRQPPWSALYHAWRASRFRRWLAVQVREGRTPVAWFGLHGIAWADAGMMFLQRIRPALERANTKWPISLSVISDSEPLYRRTIRPWPLPTRYLPWNPASFFDALRVHSLCVIPSDLNPLTRCKSHNRLTLALSQGLAVVADVLPSYEPYRRVSALDDWEGGLERYLSDPAARRRDVEAGRALIDERCSERRIADDWHAFFERINARSHRA